MLGTFAGLVSDSRGKAHQHEQTETELNNGLVAPEQAVAEDEGRQQATDNG